MKKIKLQYYLRGLGVGILVTSMIMGTMMSGQKETLSDAEIKKRAIELGMVDESSLVLSDLQTNSVVQNKEVQNEEVRNENVQNEDVQNEEPQNEGVQTEQEEQIEETQMEVLETEDVQTDSLETPEASSQEEPTLPENEVSAVKVSITIQSGADSYSVSKMLADAGLVADAKAYDTFLCNMGYSRYIHTGSYAIALGTSEEEIAKIITGNR